TQERPDILGILERIERQDKGCLATVGRSGEDLLRGRVTSRRDDQSDALVSIKPGQRRQRPALHLDDWNSEVGRVQDKLLEGLPPAGTVEEGGQPGSGQGVPLGGTSLGRGPAEGG